MTPSNSLTSSARVLSRLAATGLLFAMAVSACSSNDAVATVPVDAGPPPCDNAKCLPGNTCLPLDGVVQCRRTCTSNVDPSANCPFGYTCVATATDVAPFCVKDNTALTKAPAGQWGAPCAATGGFDANPDCDSAQGFSCFGVSPSDGEAYCTLFGCETDRDCGAGFYCGDANVAPNVVNANRTLGETQRVCLRRDYCAPCKADVDCPPLGGVRQRCIGDDNGAGFCTPECTSTKNCNKDATCAGVFFEDGTEGMACYPRAGACVGDGAICAPCRSDKDCGEDGICVQGQFTAEKSCAKKSAIPCKYDGKNAPVPGKDFECPTAESPAGANVACLGQFFFDQVPRDYCHGIYGFGESADVGCWTPSKKK